MKPSPQTMNDPSQYEFFAGYDTQGKSNAKFGEQGFFVNAPSRFIGPDGRTAWLCYSANFAGGTSNPAGRKPGLTLQRIRLVGPTPKTQRYT